MTQHKELRIGLIGGGFMGRTHSNAYNQVSHFFPELHYRPVCKPFVPVLPKKYGHLRSSGATNPVKPIGRP